MASDQCGITYYAYQDASVTGTCPKTVLRTWTVGMRINAASYVQTITITDNTRRRNQLNSDRWRERMSSGRRAKRMRPFDLRRWQGFQDTYGRMWWRSDGWNTQQSWPWSAAVKCSAGARHTPVQSKGSEPACTEWTELLRGVVAVRVPRHGSAPAAITGVNACLPSAERKPGCIVRMRRLRLRGYTDGCGGAADGYRGWWVHGSSVATNVHWSVVGRPTQRVKMRCGNYLHGNPIITHAVVAIGRLRQELLRLPSTRAWILSANTKPRPGAAFGRNAGCQRLFRSLRWYGYWPEWLAPRSAAAFQRSWSVDLHIQSERWVR